MTEKQLDHAVNTKRIIQSYKADIRLIDRYLEENETSFRLDTGNGHSFSLDRETRGSFLRQLRAIYEHRAEEAQAELEALGVTIDGEGQKA